MKIALVEIVNIARKKWAVRNAVSDFATKAPGQGNSAPPRFPTIVAHTTEGDVMNGPRGLQLITEVGPTPVYETPRGFLVYNPQPHILQPIKG